MSETENTIRLVILGIPREREKDLMEFLWEGVKKNLFTTNNIHIRYEKAIEP